MAMTDYWKASLSSSLVKQSFTGCRSHVVRIMNHKVDVRQVAQRSAGLSRNPEVWLVPNIETDQTDLF